MTDINSDQKELANEEEDSIETIAEEVWAVIKEHPKIWKFSKYINI